MRNLTAPFILSSILSLGGTSFAAAVRVVRAMSAFCSARVECLLRPMAEVNRGRRPSPPDIKRRRNIVTYVDGFVAAVPTTNREIYKKHAEAAAVVFKENGALKFVECWGDDVPDGKLTSFPLAVKQG